MQTFLELREKLGRKPTGTIVYDKKINKIPVQIYKDNKGFTAYVDGDRLDSFKSQKDAQRSAENIVKELT
jgi:hypothetical protein